MKRWIVFVLALTLCFCTTGSVGEEEWKYESSRGWGYVNHYSGAGGDLVIPAELDGHPIQGVRTTGLTHRDDITSCTVSEGILLLSSGFLSGAKNLTSVHLPDTLQVLQTQCFFHCESLTEITIPASVRYIQRDVLTWCKALRSVTFEGPCPVFLSGNDLLQTNDKDLVVYVPDDQLEAYRAAITGLKSEQIQPSGRNATPWAESRAEFKMDPETGTLLQCTTVDTWVDIPAEIDGIAVKKIGTRAFFPQENIFVVMLPEGLEEIESEAFSGMGGFQYVPIPSTVRVIGEGAYKDYGGRTITLPEGLREISRQAFYHSGISMDLTIPEGIERIGEEAFSGSYLYAVSIPSSVASIGEKAFKGEYLKRIYFDTLTLPDIAADAFENQANDIAVTLPPAATAEDVSAAQAFFDTLGGSFTVTRLDLANGIYPNSPYSQAAAVIAEAPAATGEPAPAATEAAAPTAEPNAQEDPSGTDKPAAQQPPEGISTNREDYIGAWYSIYYGTGGFTGDPREAYSWQDEMILNADGSAEGNLGESLDSWEMDEAGQVWLEDLVPLMLLPSGYLQYNNRSSGYMIFSRDKDAVWDPATRMYEDLYQASVPEVQTPEPTAAVAAPVQQSSPGAGDGSIALDTKYVCVRYQSSGYEMDASLLGAELSVILHADGSLTFNMLGSEMAGLTWSWDGSDAVVDYFGAGQLRFSPGEDGTLLLDFMGTITYILSAQP